MDPYEDDEKLAAFILILYNGNIFEALKQIFI
jgi:hypothetical protein